MRTGSRFAAFVILASMTLCSQSPASAHSQRKAKKPPLPTLPSGPLGPVQSRLPDFAHHVE